MRVVVKQLEAREFCQLLTNRHFANGVGAYDDDQFHRANLQKWGAATTICLVLTN